MPRIDVVCSYCKRKYGEKFIDRDPKGHQSHGICPNCEPILRSAVKKGSMRMDATTLFLTPQIEAP